MRARGFFLCAMLVLGGGVPALADDCALQIVTTVNMEALGAVHTVPVTINGVERHFLLDTGASMSTISVTADKELGLPIRASNVRMFDVNGNATNASVMVSQFGIGKLSGKDLEFNIAPGKLEGFDGLLGADLLYNYDVDLDFGSGKVNLIKSHACPGQVLYWQAKALAIVPMRFLDHDVVVPITIDGHDFKAIIDTGASRSAINQISASAAFGIKLDSPDVTLGGAINGDPTMRMRLHKFGQLSFGDVAVSNLTMDIMPDRIGLHDVNNGYATGSLVTKVDDGYASDAIVGMDVLRHLHVYIAYKEEKVYITEASAPAK